MKKTNINRKHMKITVGILLAVVTFFISGKARKRKRNRFASVTSH